MPRPSWNVKAQLPLNDDPSRARVVEVEASHSPTLMIRDATTSMELGDRGAAWPGKGAFFVPAGVRIDDIRIVGYCDGGACCRCETPKTVQVSGMRQVDSWRIEQRGEVDRASARAKRISSSRVTLRAAPAPSTAAAPPRLRIESNVQPAWVQTYKGGFNVSWPERNEPFEWRPVVVIEGACASGESTCAPPAGAELVIENVESESIDVRQ